MSRFDMRDMRTRFQQMSDNHRSRHPNSGGGRGEIPAWKLRMNKHKFTKEGSLLQIYPGNYEGWPFYEYWEAWIAAGGRKQNLLCNCKGGQSDESCVLCHYEREEENPAFIPKLRIAVNAIELAIFHKVTKTSKANREYTVLEKCRGTNELGHNECPHCDARLPTVFGRKVYLGLGKGYWETLTNIAHKLSRMCKTCGGQIFTLRYYCAECDETFADPSQRTITKEDQAMYDQDKITCPSCGHTDYAEKKEQCFKRGEDAKLVESCDNTEPSTLFDMPLHLGVVGDGANSSLMLMNEDDLQVTPMDPRVVDMARPYDFPKFLGGMPCSEQAEKMGKPNPFEGENPSGGSGKDVNPY